MYEVLLTLKNVNIGGTVDVGGTVQHMSTIHTG